MSENTNTVADIVEAEVRRHHAALQKWLGGEADSAFFDSEIASALNENFEWIKASGEQTTRGTILDWIRSRRGKSPGRRISVQDFRIVAQVGNIAVSRYTEKFADQPGQEPAVRRQATAVLMLEPRLQWLHVFETCDC